MNQLRVAEEIRVAVLAPDEWYRVLENDVLFGESDLHLVGHSEHGADGPSLVAREEPHVVLVTAQLADMTGPELIEKLRGLAPCILLANPPFDVDLVSRAFMSGVRDVLIDPGPHKLAETIRSIAHGLDVEGSSVSLAATSEIEQDDWVGPLPDARGKEVVGRVVVLYAAKGGVGCSSTTALLARAGLEAHLSVCVVDLAFTGGMQDLLLGATGVTDRHLARLADGMELDDIVLRTQMGAYLIAAPPLAMFGALNDLHIVALLEQLRSRFDLILFDTVPSLTPIQVTVIGRADAILCVLVPELPSIKTTRMFLNVYERLTKGGNLQLILNKSDKERERAVGWTEVERLLGVPVSLRIPTTSGGTERLLRGMDVSADVVAYAHALVRGEDA